MVRKTGCEKYIAWKKEQANKLKKTKKKVKKRKQEDLAKDCLDEDEQDSVETKPPTKISYRKCKKKRKKKKPTRLVRKIFKYVPEGELVMKCIKPSVEDRQYVLSARHNVCMGLSESKVNFALEGLQTASSQLFYMPKRLIRRYKRKPCGKKRVEEPESDDSECDSICSFDSDICLAGVKLTAKDKEEIKKFQREAQEAGDKGEMLS